MDKNSKNFQTKYMIIKVPMSLDKIVCTSVEYFTKHKIGDPLTSTDAISLSDFVKP